MNSLTSRRRLASLLALAFALTVPANAGATIPVDLRVATHNGKTLADYVQYTGPATVRTSHKARCFGKGNPSRDRRYHLKGANLLGALADAAHHDAALRPLLLTDAFIGQGFGLGVCGIGGDVAHGASFWYSAVDRMATSTGASLTKLHRGDDALWYLTSGSESGFPSQLVLHAPVRVRAHKPFSVRVTRATPAGKSAPASDVRVTGAQGRTDSSGRTTEPGKATGTLRLKATGTGDDVSSAAVAVCVSGNISNCPARRGKTIFGTAGADRITTTAGPDRVNCGGGRDVVVVRRKDRSDHIAKNCEKVVRK